MQIIDAVIEAFVSMDGLKGSPRGPEQVRNRANSFARVLEYRKIYDTDAIRKAGVKIGAEYDDWHTPRELANMVVLFAEGGTSASTKVS